MKIQSIIRLKNLTNLLNIYHSQFEHESNKRRVDIGDLEMLVTIESPFRPRTVGEGSQNHALNWIIQVICQETGQDFKTTKEYIKSKAVGMGYPMLKRKRMEKGQIVEEVVTDWYGNPRGISEADSSVSECSILIDCALMLASELGIVINLES